MLVHIDTPPDSTVTAPFTHIVGWCADDAPLGEIALRIGEVALPTASFLRPDVVVALPAKATLGFSAILDLSRHLDAKLEIELLHRGEPVHRVDLRLADGVLAKARQMTELAARKRRWCLEHLRCPVCKAPLAPSLTCNSCHTEFPQSGRALHLTPAGPAEPSANVSSHPYDSIACEITEAVRARGGMVLDCGAGLRSRHDASVVNLEIFDYPSTDIIAPGDSLPFEDAAFDAVFSLSVLEHVANPFTCAGELARVLKPGGTLYCVTPFLQPEHSYPHHFYNMTREGVRNLFEGKLAIAKHFVPQAGLPIWCLHWFLSQYLAHLDPASRSHLKQMTVAELVAKPPQEYLSEPIVRGLDDEGKWILACTNSLILQKAGGDSEVTRRALAAAEKSEAPVDRPPAPSLWERLTRRGR